MTAMRAKLFNEENIIKEKMKKMQIDHEKKLSQLQIRINELQNENAKLRRDSSKTVKVRIGLNAKYFYRILGKKVLGLKEEPSLVMKIVKVLRLKEEPSLVIKIVKVYRIVYETFKI